MISGSSPPHHCYREEFLHFLPAVAAAAATAQHNRPKTKKQQHNPRQAVSHSFVHSFMANHNRLHIL